MLYLIFGDERAVLWTDRLFARAFGAWNCAMGIFTRQTIRTAAATCGGRSSVRMAIFVVDGLISVSAGCRFRSEPSLIIVGWVLRRYSLALLGTILPRASGRSAALVLGFIEVVWTSWHTPLSLKCSTGRPHNFREDVALGRFLRGFGPAAYCS